MKKLIHKLMPLASSAAMGLALCIIGTTCRTFLYQPVVPASLRDMD